jgi:hypothetical protein
MSGRKGSGSMSDGKGASCDGAYEHVACRGAAFDWMMDRGRDLCSSRNLAQRPGSTLSRPPKVDIPELDRRTDGLSEVKPGYRGKAGNHSYQATSSTTFALHSPTLSPLHTSKAIVTMAEVAGRSVTIYGSG